MINPPFPGLPRTVQHASFWIDESGSRASAGKGFVLAGIKTRHPDALQRALHEVRERFGHCKDEFKFTSIREANLHRYRAWIDVLRASDARVIATVVDRSANPFPGTEEWATHAMLAARLIQAGLNKNEVACAFLDLVTTPPAVSIGPLVKRHVNGALRGQFLTTAVSLNSKTNDVLQLADLIAGAIRYERFEVGRARDDSPKLLAAREVALALGVVDLADQRGRRVTIATNQIKS